MIRKLSAIFAVFLTSAAGLYAQSEKITPDLSAALEDARPAARVRVIVAMSAKYAFRPYSVFMAEQRPPARAQRLDELRKFSAADQAPVAEILARAEAEKKVSDISYNRVKNLVSFRGSPDIIREISRRDDVAMVYPFDAARFADENVSDEELNIVDYTRDFEEAFKKLSDANPIARRHAVMFLARENTPETVGAAISALEDEDALVRRSAAEVLGRFAPPPPSARRALAEYIGRETDVAAKISAIRSAGALGGPALTDILRRLVSDPYAVYRAEALKALGRLNDASSAALIISAVSDEAEGVRIAAMESAARLKLSRAAAPAVKNLSDRVALVRRAAAAALGYIGGEDALEPLRKTAADDPENYVRVEAANSVELIRSRLRSPAVR